MGESGFFFRLLGPLVVERNGVAIPLGAPQARKVFAILALAGNRVVPAERIIAALWEEQPPASARVQVQGLISQLRRALRAEAGEQPIETAESGYLLRIPPAGSDLALFTALTGDGRAELARGQCARAVRLFRQALELWRGPVLADVALPGAAALVSRLEELRCAALEDRAEAGLRLAEHPGVVLDLRELLEQQPYRERACELLLTALARSGRSADALAEYRRWQARLRADLGLEPSPALRELHGRILRAEAGLQPPGLGTPHQLPPQLPGFVAREELTGELRAALTAAEREAPPVLVLTGMAGIGKTALALRVAHRVCAEFPDGQLFADLHGTGTPAGPAMVLAGFLRALGVPADRIPAEVEERAGLLRSRLHGRRVLLVLDDAAEEAQLRPLLPGASGCAVLVTSRCALDGLDAARSFPLEPLPDADAVSLLADLAGEQRIEAGSVALARVLRACAGLPLALRIVGSRLADCAQWTVTEAAEALADPRSRLEWLHCGDLSVRDRLELSRRGLDPLAQQVFDGLGLAPSTEFPGWSAALLAGAGAEHALAELVRRNLVRVVRRADGPPRYRQHELVRVFARERARPEEVLPRVLGGWLWLAEQAADRLPRSILRPAPGESVRWPLDAADSLAATEDPHGWFELEQESVQDAVAAAAAHGQGELAWELAVTAAGYFDHHGRYPEWTRCHRRALGAARAAGRVRGEAALLRGLGQVHLYSDEFGPAGTALLASKRLSERIGDRGGVASALTGLSVLSRVTGRQAESLSRARQALELYLALGDRLGVAHLHTSIAFTHLNSGRLGMAETALEQAARVCVELDDSHRTALLLRRYGQLHLARGEAERARACLRQAVELLEALRDKQCAAQVRVDLGRAHAVLGEHRAAARELADASTLFTGAGNLSSAATCARLLGTLTG